MINHHSVQESPVLATANWTLDIDGTVQQESTLRKLFRTLQVNVPLLQDFRFALQRAFRKFSNTVNEPDFDALRLLPWLNNSTVVDIGANRGDTIQSIKMRTSSANVLAFEPNPLIYSRLRRLFKHDPAVKLFNFGLGAREEILPLNVPIYKNFVFDGLASFVPEAALKWLEERIYFYDEKYLKLRRIECCITTLDKFEIQPSFIKIDVQGFEHQVLTGARETLSTSRPIVLVETPDWDTRSLMRRDGFSPYRYATGKLLPGLGRLNTFFIPREKESDVRA